MKDLQKMSQKAAAFCELSGHNVAKVKKAMKLNYFAVQVCETKKEMEDKGVDFNFPYCIYNPYNLDIDLDIDE